MALLFDPTHPTRDVTNKAVSYTHLDKRIFRLYISPSANETLNVLNKVSNRFFKLLLEDLKDEELMFFDEVLNKMIKNLNNLKI